MHIPPNWLTQLAGALEHTDCISAENWDVSHNKYTGYDTKQSDGEAPVLELWRMWSTLSLPLLL